MPQRTVPAGRRLQLRPRIVRAVLRPEGPLALRDLGYVEGRRVHVVPAWSVSPEAGLTPLISRVREVRPQADTVVLPATGPGVLQQAEAFCRAASGGPRLLVARAAAERCAGPAPDVSAIDVTGEHLEEAAALLTRLAWVRTTHAAALALAGYWHGAVRTGSDVVVILADLEPLPPAAAA